MLYPYENKPSKIKEKDIFRQKRTDHFCLQHLVALCKGIDTWKIKCEKLHNTNSKLKEVRMYIVKPVKVKNIKTKIIIRDKKK